MGVTDTKNFLRNREIACQKYNYSLDKRYQNLDHYVATLRLSKDAKTLHIYNIKPQEYKQMEIQHENKPEDSIEYEREKINK